MNALPESHRSRANSHRPVTPMCDVISILRLVPWTRGPTPMRARFGLLALTVAAGGLTHCGSETPVADDEVGEAEVALTNAPTDVSCLRLTVSGTARTDVRKFPLTSGQRTLFRLNGLPV